MNAVRLLLFSLLFITNSYSSECGLDDSIASVCSKNKKVKSLVELNTYLSNYAEKDGVYRNLIIDFDLNTEADINIHSPCKIVFKKARSHSFKNICVNGREGVYFQNDTTVNADNISLYSKKRIAIRHHADITAKDLSLISNGEGLDSRVHIRHNSQIKVDNLTLEADARATLGNTSVYTIANSVNISSNIEFSAIWKNTSVNAQSVNILSNNKNLLSKNTSINSPVINLSAPECNISKLTVTGNSGGNCFDTSRPTAKLSRSAKEINAGESVSFSAKKSSDNLGIIKYSFFINSELVRENQNPEFSHRFIEGGTYYVQVVVEDADGYRASATKKIVVAETLARSEGSYFDYRIEENNLSLVFHQMIPYEEISSAKFIITELDGEQGVFEFPISNFYHRSEKVIEDFGDGDYKIGLSVIDIYNREFLYERVVNYTGEENFYKNSPIVEFEITPVDPKEIMVDFRKVFDPSDRIEWVEIDWGDGSEEEVDFETAIFLKHKYSNTGEYEVKVIVAKEIDDEESLSESIRVVNVTSEEVSALPPLVDYNIIIEEFAPYVTFNVDRSISPNAEITSVVFDHGDGTFYSGTNFVHTHFYEPGVYIVRLTVTDSNGLSVTQSAQVIITDPSTSLVASVDCESASSHLGVECEIAAIDKLSELTEIRLDWGDGTIQEIPLLQGDFTWDYFEHAYAEVGSYNVTLSVKNIREEVKTSVFSLNVQEEGSGENQLPYAYINCIASGGIKEVQCDFSSSNDSDGFIENFNIKISDGSEFNFTNSSPLYHTFSSSGSYDILLTVTDNSGSTSIHETTIELINQSPIVDAYCESNAIREITCTSYSYDPDGYIVNTEFEWGEGELSGTEIGFTTQLSHGGFKDVKVSVVDNEGDIQVMTYSVYVIQNQAPVASFSCVSNRPGSLSCVNHSYDADGVLLAYLWTVDGEQYFSKDIELQFESDKIAEISLVVSDEFNVTNEFRTEFETLSDEPTEISMNCNQIAPSLFDCNVDAYDISGVSSVSSYYKDELVSDKYDFRFYFDDGAGAKEFRVIAVDFFGNSSESLFSFSADQNLLPVTNAECFSNKPYTITCSSAPIDENGGITSVEWSIDGIIVSVENNFEVDYGSILTKEIKLMVTDSSNQNVVENFTVQSRASELIPFIECEQLVEYKFLCTGENSYSSHGEISNYKWIVNNLEYAGQSITFEIGENEDLELSLTINNSDNEVTKMYSLEEVKYIPIPSSNVAHIISPDQSTFNSKASTLRLNLNEFSFSVNDENEILDVKITLNGIDLNINTFSVIDSLYVKDVIFDDGKNELGIMIVEQNGKSYKEDFVFVSGSRSLTLNDLSNIGCEQKITLFELETNEKLLELISSNPSTAIANFPLKMDFYGYSECLIGNSLYSVPFYIPKNENSVTYELDKDTVVNNIDNLNFKDDVTGWKISKGDFSLINSSDSSGNPKKYIRLLPDEGEALVKTRFRYDDKYVSVKFNLKGSFESSEVGILILRNEGTGELLTTTLSEFNTSFTNNSHVVNYKNILESGVDYSISYFTKRKFDEDEDFVNNTLFNFGWLINNAYADSTLDKINDLSAEPKNVNALAYSCKSLSDSSCIDRLSTITLSGIDPKSKFKRNNKIINRVSVGLEGNLSTELEKSIVKYQLVVASPGMEDFVLGESVKLNSSKRMFVEFSDNSIFNGIEKVKLSFRGVDHQGKSVINEPMSPNFRVGSAYGKPYFVKLDEFYTTTSILVNNNGFDIERYTENRECELGCDSYVLTSNKTKFTDILKKEFSIEEKTYKFKFNDLQVMNSAIFRSVGSHNSGIDVDVQVFEVINGETSNAPVPIDSEVMVDIINNLAIDENIRYIFSYMPNYSARLKAGCTKGVAHEFFIRPMTPGHGDHLHLRIANPEIDFALKRFDLDPDKVLENKALFDSVAIDRDSSTYYSFSDNSSSKGVSLEIYRTSDQTPEKLREPDYGTNEFLDLDFVFKYDIGIGIACDARPSIEFSEDTIDLDSTTNQFYMSKGTGVLSGIYTKHSKVNDIHCTSSGTDWYNSETKANKIATGSLGISGGTISLYDYYKIPDELISTHAISMFSTRDIHGDIKWVGNLNPPLQNSLGENVGFNVKGIAGSFGECLSRGSHFLLHNGGNSSGMSIYLEGD